jgi:hypothetical protein
MVSEINAHKENDSHFSTYKPQKQVQLNFFNPFSTTQNIQI